MDKKKLLLVIEGLVAAIAASQEGGAEDADNQHLARGLIGRALKSGPVRESLLAACITAPVTAPANVG